MKTFFSLIVLIVILNISPVDAQLLRAYSLKIGCDKAELRTDYSSQIGGNSYKETIWGLDAGAFVEFFNYPNFSLLTEIYYIQKGRTIIIQGTMIDRNNPNGYIDVGPEEIKERFEYISIPILAKFRVNRKTITPYVAGGPSIEYLINFPGSDVYKKFNKVELAVKAVFGIELSFYSMPTFLLECRYNYSITDTYKNEFVTYRSRALELLLGVAF